MAVRSAGRRPLSLNNRVMLFVGVTISLSMFLIGHLVLKAVERHFIEQDVGELKVITQAVEHTLQKAVNRSLAFSDALTEAVSGHHGVYFIVWNEDDELIYAPEDTGIAQELKAYTPLEDIRPDNLYNWKSNGNAYSGSVVIKNIGGRNYRIASAINMDFHIKFLINFRRSLWLIMVVAGAITLLAAWYGVHQGHAPLRVLSEAMRNIHADRLHVRLDTQTMPSELKPLVDSFNRMISRLEDSFVRLSNFSADIAHELRTPLTNLITQTQVGLSKSRSLDEYRELLYSNLEEQERLTKMVNDMLWLAQSEHGLIRPELESLNLIVEVQAIFEFFEALAEEKGIALVIEGSPVTVQGDRSMLRRVISNLLSNAIRYTNKGEEIRIQVGQEEKGAYISVENPGLAIPPEHLANLFDRFYRVEPSRYRDSEGAGLGLAIVKSVVEAHGGNVSVASEPGRTCFTVSVPIS